MKRLIRQTILSVLIAFSLLVPMSAQSGGPVARMVITTGLDAQAYWYGGTRSQRKDADDALRDCVASHGHKILAWIMWIGVRIFGSPRSLLPFRWARKVTIVEGLARGYAAGTSKK